MQIVAAEEDEITAVGDSPRPLSEWSGLERRDLDIPKLATLHSLLTNDLFDDAMSLYEPIYASPEGALVLRIADSAFERLATLDEDVTERIADELAATEEFELAEWPLDATLDLVTELADLAQLADSQGQILVVWLTPLAG